ncbi:hypothetical protein ACLOJK_014585 [Asimina triloba]
MELRVEAPFHSHGRSGSKRSCQVSSSAHLRPAIPATSSELLHRRLPRKQLVLQIQHLRPPLQLLHQQMPNRQLSEVSSPPFFNSMASPGAFASSPSAEHAQFHLIIHSKWPIKIRRSAST